MQDKSCINKESKDNVIDEKYKQKLNYVLADDFYRDNIYNCKFSTWNMCA